MQTLNFIGSLITLGIILYCSGNFARGVTKLFWQHGLQERAVDENDIKTLISESFVKQVCFALSHKAASGMFLATLFGSWFLGSDFHAAVGFSAVVFLTACIANSMFLRVLRAFALSFVLFVGCFKAPKASFMAAFAPLTPHSS